MGPAAALNTSPGDDGLLPVAVAGTRVLFDGVAAPLVSVSATRVTAIVPYVVDGKTSTQAVIEYNGDKSAAVTLAVVAAQPGVFTVDGSGVGQAQASNDDGTANSADAPAAPGMVVTVLVTGLGQIDPPGTDGLIATDTQPTPLLPVAVLLNGVEVEFDGARVASGSAAGYFAVQFRVPDGLDAGVAEIRIRVGDSTLSQPGVTIAVAGGSAN